MIAIENTIRIDQALFTWRWGFLLNPAHADIRNLRRVYIFIPGVKLLFTGRTDASMRRSRKPSLFFSFSFRCLIGFIGHAGVEGFIPVSHEKPGSFVP